MKFDSNNKHIMFSFAVVLAIISVILIYFITKHKREQYDYTTDVNKIIQDKYNEIVSKKSLNKKQKAIIENFINKTVNNILKYKPSKMKASKRAQLIFTENRKIINKRKNIKIIVIGKDRYIFDKKTNKLLEKSILEEFSFGDIFSLKGAEAIGRGIASGFTTGDWTIKVGEASFSESISCIGQEGLNPTCPKISPPERPTTFWVDSRIPFWQRESSCYLDQLVECVKYDGEVFPDGLDEPVRFTDSKVILDSNSELSWSEFLSFIAQKNEDKMREYNQQLLEWHNLPPTGYCCYGPSSPQTDAEGRATMGTCSTTPCKSDTDEIIDILPGLLAGLGASLIAAGYGLGAVAAAAILIKIGLILIAIAIVLFIVMVIIGILGWKPSGKNKEGLESGRSSVNNVIENGLPVRQLDEQQQAITVVNEFNDGDIDNMVVDITDEEVGDDSVSSGTSNGNGYVSVPNTVGGILPDEFRRQFWDGTSGGTIAEGVNCDLVDCNIRNRNNVFYLLRQLICCNYDFRRNFIFTPPILPPVNRGEYCSPVCYNGYPGIRCVDRETGEVVSETWEGSQNVARCCRNECINDTWHTICPPHPGIDTETSCDQRQPKL